MARLKVIVPLALTSFILSVFITGAYSTYPADGRIAIVNKRQKVLTVVNLKDHSRQVFDVGYLPHETVVAQGRVFVSNYGNDHVRSSDLANSPGNTLSIIDLTRPNPPVEVLDLGAGRCAPHGLAVSHDERHVFVTCEGRQEILVIDAATQKIGRSIPTHQAGSHMLTVSSDGTRAFVANFWHGTVSVLDLREGKILAQIETGPGTEGIGLSPDDRYLYTTSVLKHEIVKVDTRTLQVIAKKAVGEGKGPIRVLATPDGGKTLVVNCADDDTVVIVDAETLDIRHEIQVGDLPIGIALRDARYAYSANMNDGTISVVNIETGKVDGTIAAGDQPDGIAYISN